EARRAGRRGRLGRPASSPVLRHPRCRHSFIMRLAFMRSARARVAPVVRRNADGVRIVDRPIPADLPQDEDLIVCDVPVGRMTYGYHRFSEKTFRGLKSIGRFCSIAEDVS